ncbi:MAG: hypothetical protein ACYDDA_10370 [Acidiferrobacteraceae bacterium]
MKVSRVRDHSGEIRFTPAILPPYLRTPHADHGTGAPTLPEGRSAGECSGTLAALLGRDAPGMSAGRHPHAG